MILDPPGAPGAEAQPRPSKSFRIGDVRIDSPFVLAPLAGVSDSPFRQLAREQGASAVYTEMVSSDGLVRGSRNTLDYCAFEAMERPIGIDHQLAACSCAFSRPTSCMYSPLSNS